MIQVFLVVSFVMHVTCDNVSRAPSIPFVVFLASPKDEIAEDEFCSG